MDNKTINYRIKGIELVYKKMEPMPPKGVGIEFSFDLRVETRVSPEHKLLIPYVTVRIRGGAEASELANIGVSCLFEIDEFEKNIILNKKGLYEVPLDLEAILRPIAISTARGVIFAELRGTYLDRAILPIVPIAAMEKK